MSTVDKKKVVHNEKKPSETPLSFAGGLPLGGRVGQHSLPPAKLLTGTKAFPPCPVLDGDRS
jgi:hypothetical protein